MDYRTRERLKKLDKLSFKAGANIYFADQLEDGYSVYNATKKRDLGKMNREDFESWSASVGQNEPESVIFIDDIPEQ